MAGIHPRLRIVIVGGVAAGASAAARARRRNEESEIFLLEAGRYVSFANCGLPYYVGGEICDRKGLLVTSEERFLRRLRVDVRTQLTVEQIDREKHRVIGHNDAGDLFRESYDRLILAPGALPIRPPIPGIDASNIWFLRTIDDAVTLRAFLESRHPENAVVIGAGFIGLEVVEALLRQHLSVTLIEMAPQVLPPLDGEIAAVVATALREGGVDLVLGDGIAAFEGEQEATGVVLQSGRRIRGDLFVAGLGVRPNVALAKEAGLRLGPKGGIWVDEQMRTSDPEIFAAGDAVEGVDRVTGEPALFALAGPANKQGRTAGENAAGGHLIYHGALGTAIVRSGSVVAAITGISQRRAEAINIPYQVNYTVSPHHADYYPGGNEMLIKLLWSPTDGRVLGAQIVGGSGVDKRIDVLATALWNGMTIDDLADLDLAYAPPFSSAKDPVIVAGMAASNRQRGLVEGILPEELDTALTAAHRLQLVDVRDPQEFQSGSIAGAINLPLNQLREQLRQLDPNDDTVVFCRSGQRSYQAERILVQHGFRHVRNLSGGYLAWSAYITSKSGRAPLAEAYLQEEFLR